MDLKFSHQEEQTVYNLMHPFSSSMYWSAQYLQVSNNGQILLGFVRHGHQAQQDPTTVQAPTCTKYCPVEIVLTGWGLKIHSLAMCNVTCIV